MFQLQTLNNKVCDGPNELDYKAKVNICRLFAWTLKARSGLRREIIQAETFPSTFWDPTEPGWTSGISYQLEKQDLKMLYAMLKIDHTITDQHMSGPVTDSAKDQAMNELHAVYRLLRQACTKA